jgi:branched-chain amino acid transport system substrate-binding protein
MGSPNVASVAEAALEATRGPAERRIVVSTGDSGAPARRVSPLHSEVDRSMRFARMRTVVAVVGPGGSREALQTAPVYRDAGVPNVIPTATSGRLRGLGPWSFLLAPNDSIQGQFIGDFVARRLGARSATLFYIPDEYGLGLLAGTAAALARNGVTRLAQLPVRPNGLCAPRAANNAYDDVVADALRSGVPDAVILATRTLETACLARAILERAPATIFVAGDGALVTPDFVRLAGPAADSIYLVAFWHRDKPDTASRAFAERFQSAMRRQPRHDEAMFYDAVMLVGAAIRAVGPDRRAVRDYLEQLGRSRPAYAGITGPISFAPGAARPLLMTRLRDGATEPVPTP